MINLVKPQGDYIELDKEEVSLFKKNMENSLWKKSNKQELRNNSTQNIFHLILSLLILFFFIFLLYLLFSDNSKNNKSGLNKIKDISKSTITIDKENIIQEELPNSEKDNQEQSKKDNLHKLMKKHNLRNPENNANNNNTQILIDTEKKPETKIKTSSINNTENTTQNITSNLTSITPYKKRIYVKYCDFWSPFELEKFDVHLLWSEKYDVVFSDNPQYVAYSCFGGEHSSYKNAVKLFISLERVLPDFSECDYAIGSYLIENMGDRYMRKPWTFPIISKYETLYNISQYWEEKGVISNKTEKKFCGWVVSNGGCSERNRFFEMLSKYKRVDSGGGYMNNVGGKVRNKMEFLAHYKFSICFENSKEYGYGTEKLPQCFNSGSIPIYWGDDSMVQIYNNKSYIHITNESQFDDVIKYIIQIDQNDTLYNEIIHQDVYLDKVKQHNWNVSYNKFIMDVVDQDFEKAKRVGRKRLMRNNSSINNETDQKII